MRYLLAVLLFTGHTTLAVGVVKLSGRIQNPSSDSIEVSYNSNKIAYYPNDYYATLDKKGRFSFKFPLPDGVYVQAEIRHGNKIAEVILRNGDSLYLTADAFHFDSTIHYAGRGAGIQNFVALHSLRKGRMNQYTIKMREAINHEPADFLKNIEKERKSEMDFLHKNKAGLPESFRNYWAAFFQYYNYFFMQQYPQVHEMLRVRRYTDTIPVENYVVLKEMPHIFYDTLLQVPSYLLYLTGVFDVSLKAARFDYLAKDTTSMRQYQDSIYTLAYTKLPDKSAEYFVAQGIYGSAKYQDLARTESQLARFKRRWPQSEYRESLEKQVNIARVLAPGQPAPDFDIITADGKRMRLSEFKGKVVYLGFWASWCRQCLSEMARERKVKDLITNKPLEFVNVSIDEDTASENLVIQKYKLDGVFTTVHGGWNAKEIQAYGVQSLPAYFLIDEEGNFALQNATTPANPTQMILDIEKLFK